VIYENARPQTLGLVRVVVFSIWLVKIIPDPFFFLAELPRSIFKPAGVLRIVPEAAWQWLLDADVLNVFKIVVVVLLALAVLGIRPYRLIAILCAVCLTLHQGLVRSFTFVNHQELAALFCVYALAIFPAADGLSIAKPARKHSSPHIYPAALLTMTILLLLPYCAIAAFRIVNSAPAIFLDDSLAYWFGSLSGLDADGWSLGKWMLRQPLLLAISNIGFPIITGFELLAPLCLIMPRFRRVWVVVMVLFHCLSWMILNIFFWENVLLIVLFLTRSGDAILRSLDHPRWSRRIQGASSL